MGNMIPELMEMQTTADIFIFEIEGEVQIKYEHVLRIMKQSLEINILMLASIYFIHAKSNYKLAN